MSTAVILIGIQAFSYATIGLMAFTIHKLSS